MTRTAHVNYHVHASGRQAFEIDAGGIVGNLISPELVDTQIALHDLRQGAAPNFATDGVAFARSPSTVRDFGEKDAWQAAYDTELTDLLKRRIKAQEVIIFDHTVRTDDPNATRKPARNVHSDYSVKGAEQRLIDLLGAEDAAEWATGHYAFVNVWRPISHPINSAPLGFVRPSSVAAQDWITLDLIYPDRRGSIMGLAANDKHEWVYQSKMTPDEVVFFNIYDNAGRPPVAHSAIDLVEDPTVISIRQSIESRTLVRYQPEALHA
ncbi:MAG: CmcJ/NvfI family oxidoreductase [Sedimentitalea sp.]|uniref:CmcJ/NvfI family oxidoreductase n=1 Tax=Sedimentitalea sp. TaxID=2048915 RepID=UPI0032672A3D